MYPYEILPVRFADRHGREELLNRGALSERLIETQRCRIKRVRI
jgi:hypothetical protein